MTDLHESLKKLQKLQKRPDGLTSNEWQTIRKNLNKLRKRQEQEFDPRQHKAKTQSDLAKMFIRWYFAVILSVLILVLAYNATISLYFNDRTTVISLKDIFMMVSGAITPILAFVLGHYFKGDK